MNIKITHNWLLEYLDTDASPAEVQKYLSLSGPSIEKLEKAGDDYIYEVEVTSNRIDTASVMGVAREASAILPRFGKKAVLKNKSFEVPQLEKNNLKLAIVDSDKLAQRVLAVILDGIRITSSPLHIKRRLELAGIRSLNNIVDITNYVMLEIGHPTHVFDYDRIQTGKFVFRLAKKGENLTTLDGKKFILHGGEVIIDDGTGRIIDLPSIMGTENSVATPSTKRVIFFIDNLDPHLVRQASMSHGIRTLAATYNEKRPDPNLAYTALVRGLQLLKEHASANSMSSIIDIFPTPTKPSKIKVSLDFIASRIGIPVSKNDIVSILQKLDFNVEVKGNEIVVTVPTFRGEDVTIPEDIVEEIARIYGYYNLPSSIPPMVYVKQPKDVELMLEMQAKIKHFLAHLGLHEVINYSMISIDLIEKSKQEPTDFLKLKNTISEEIEYMRRHILPSLFMNIKQNEGKSDQLKLFEIAKTYKKRINDLPEESYKLGIAVNTNYADLKGIVDALLDEFHITDFKIEKSNYDYMSKHVQGEIFKGKDWIVKYGELSPLHKSGYGIKSNVYTAVFDLATFIKYQSALGNYKPINSFAEIKLDLTVVQSPDIPFAKIKNEAFKVSPLLQNVELVATFENKLNLRFYFSSTEKNITEEEAKKELGKIKAQLI